MPPSSVSYRHPSHRQHTRLTSRCKSSVRWRSPRELFDRILPLRFSVPLSSTYASAAATAAVTERRFRVRNPHPGVPRLVDPPSGWQRIVRCRSASFSLLIGREGSEKRDKRTGRCGYFQLCSPTGCLEYFEKKLVAVPVMIDGYGALSVKATVRRVKCTSHVGGHAASRMISSGNSFLQVLLITEPLRFQSDIRLPHFASSRNWQRAYKCLNETQFTRSVALSCRMTQE